MNIFLYNSKYSNNKEEKEILKIMSMKHFSKWLLVTMSACIATTAVTITSFAEETRNRITQVNLSVGSSLTPGESGGEVTVTPGNEGYSVTSVEVLNPKSPWSASDTPEVKVTLTANDGYYFPNSSNKVFYLSGYDAEYLSSSQENEKQVMILNMKLGPVGYNGLTISSANWGDNYVAQWSPTYGAAYYQIRLIRGVDAPETIGSSQTTTDTHLDLSSKIRKNGFYTFEVRAVIDSDHKGEWVKSNVITETGKDQSEATASVDYQSQGPGFEAAQGEWIQDNTGWWYKNADGSYPKATWQIVEEKWYCFDDNGYMRTGWIETDGKWYYCGESGAMLANTITPDGHTLDANGVWVQ